MYEISSIVSPHLVMYLRSSGWCLSIEVDKTYSFVHKTVTSVVETSNCLLLQIDNSRKVNSSPILNIRPPHLAHLTISRLEPQKIPTSFWIPDCPGGTARVHRSPRLACDSRTTKPRRQEESHPTDPWTNPYHEWGKLNREQCWNSRRADALFSAKNNVKRLGFEQIYSQF